MPRKKRSQLSKHSTQAILAKIRRIGESFSENSDRLACQREYASQSRARESSAERSQRLAESRYRHSRARARRFSAERSLRLAELLSPHSQLYERQWNFGLAKNGELRLKREQKEGEEGDTFTTPPAPGVELTSEDNNMKHMDEDNGDESEGELCIQIKEEVGETIPVAFLPSTSGLALGPPQYNISVAPANAGTQEQGYSISINEIQDPLLQDDVRMGATQNNLNYIPHDNLLRPRGVITVPDDLLRTSQLDNLPKRGRPKKVESETKITNGAKKKRKIKETDEDDPTKVISAVKRNPPRLAKTMTNAQELMNRKLTDIIKSQHNIYRTLKEMPSVVSASDTKSSSKEDRFDICGKHIASLLRELPTFDALALEAKLMNIVYKEREKLETFRKSLQGYSATMLPQND